MKRSCFIVLPILLALVSCGGRVASDSTESIRIANCSVELIACPSIARVMEYCPIGGPALFWQNAAIAGHPTDLVQGNQAFGGAKLWVAPQTEWESKWKDWPPCPFLDAGPCTVVASDASSIALRGLEGSRHGVRFDRKMRLDGHTAHLEYTMTACDKRAVEWGIWSVVQLRAGGRILVPLADGGVARWASSEASAHWNQVDNCWEAWQGKPRGKLILDSGQGVNWAAYIIDDAAFVISLQPGSRLEVYCAAEYVELEQVGPRVHLEPEASATLQENWHAFRLPRNTAQLPAGMLRNAITAALVPDH